MSDSAGIRSAVMNGLHVLFSIVAALFVLVGFGTLVYQGIAFLIGGGWTSLSAVDGLVWLFGPGAILWRISPFLALCPLAVAFVFVGFCLNKIGDFCESLS
jgi:hypothetical protein